MKSVVTESAHETFRLGKRLAHQLRGGDAIALVGELGAGKTTLIKGIAAGLGIKRPITSPTFLLLRVNPVRGHKRIRRFVHMDAYRIKHPSELLDVGLREYLGQPNTVTVIEWAERVRRLLPHQTTTITLRMGKQPSTRSIVIR